MMMFAALSAMVASPSPTVPPLSHPVIELRQYKIVPGHLDPFIQLFEREFIETQEAEGMELIGQFRDRADPDRFTWMRSFPGMDARQKSLTKFYFGPVWQAHRAAANPMLFDNDNVLLLRPAWHGAGFTTSTARPGPGTATPARQVVVTIHYLWKQPDEGFTTFFKDRLTPVLQRAGIKVEAALVREESANNFERLPVREGEKLFVWTTVVDSEAAWKAAVARLEKEASWPAVETQLRDFEERPAQRLFLDPTPRSKLR